MLQEIVQQLRPKKNKKGTKPRTLDPEGRTPPFRCSPDGSIFFKIFYKKCCKKCYKKSCSNRGKNMENIKHKEKTPHTLDLEGRTSPYLFRLHLRCVATVRSMRFFSLFSKVSCPTVWFSDRWRGDAWNRVACIERVV